MPQVLQKNPGKVISELNFCTVFRNAWLSADTSANICGGFKKAGVFPFNQDAVSLPENSSVCDNGDSDHADGDGDHADGNGDHVDGDGDHVDGDVIMLMVMVIMWTSVCM